MQGIFGKYIDIDLVNQTINNYPILEKWYSRTCSALKIRSKGRTSLCIGKMWETKLFPPV